ncbi:YrvL family regulatory protein [Vagococcus fluvialis]|uniref:Regulatory protein YrvL n=1 Tax=Vagococcus fluvialis TaxID=2738 RepID=A0A7X6DBG6_9ENTE|nr:YrvL family regulatory protein [Vagococcus fluvialis]NKC69299.1 hypothetical protein [Vagococcus fluvialis]
MKKQLTAILLTIIPLGGIILATLGLFKFVGVDFKNNLSLFLFLILYLFIEFIIDNIIELLASAWNNTYWMNFLRVSLAIYVTDSLLDSVSVSTITLFILATVFTIVEYILDLLDDDDFYD